jgi:hypothetical protein
VSFLAEPPEDEAKTRLYERDLADDGTAREDVERLRELGLDDREIFEATAWVALRVAFATVNDALGAAPDPELADETPEPVRAAVSWGRSPSSQ